MYKVSSADSDIPIVYSLPDPAGAASRRRISLAPCSLSGDGQRMAFVSGDGLVYCWDLIADKCIQKIKPHKKGTNAVALSADGTRMATGGKNEDSAIKYWNVDKGKCIRTIKLTPGYAACDLKIVDTADRRSYVVSATNAPGFAVQSSGAQVWDLLNKGSKSDPMTVKYFGHTKKGGDGWINTVEVYTPIMARGVFEHFHETPFNITGAGDHTLKMWVPTTGACMQTMVGHTGQVSCSAIAPNGLFLVSGSIDKSLKIWDVETGRCKNTLLGHSGGISTCAILPNGKLLISISPQQFKVWDLVTGHCIQTYEGDFPGMHHINHATKRLVSNAKDGPQIRDLSAVYAFSERPPTTAHSLTENAGRAESALSREERIKALAMKRQQMRKSTPDHAPSVAQVPPPSLSTQPTREEKLRRLAEARQRRAVKQPAAGDIPSSHVNSSVAASMPAAGSVMSPQVEAKSVRVVSGPHASSVSQNLPARDLPARDLPVQDLLDTTNVSELLDSRLEALAKQMHSSFEAKIAAQQKIIAEHSERISNIETEQLQLAQQQKKLDAIITEVEQKQKHISDRIAYLQQQILAGNKSPAIMKELEQLKEQQRILLLEHSKAKEKKIQQQRISDHPSLLFCYNHLQYKLNAWCTGYMSLSSGMVEGASSMAMQAFSILGETISIVPGVNFATSAAKMALSYRDKRNFDKKALALASLGVGTQAMDELIEVFARKLVFHYEALLCQLTSRGAICTGQWCAKPIIEWLYVVDDRSALQTDKMVDSMLSIIKQGGVSEATPSRNTKLNKLRQKLRKDHKAALQRGGEISIRTLLTKGIPGVAAPSPNTMKFSSSAHRELVIQRTELENVKQNMELHRRTQAIVGEQGGTSGDDGVRLTAEEYREFKEMSQFMAEFRHSRLSGLPSQHGRGVALGSMGANAASAMSEVRDVRIETTFSAYQSPSATGLSCSVGEDFEILQEDDGDWIFVQRVGTHQKGYLPRSCFMLD